MGGNDGGGSMQGSGGEALTLHASVRRTPAAPSCAADLSVPPDVPPHRAVPGPVTGGKQGAQGEADGSCSVPVLVILVVS